NGMLKRPQGTVVEGQHIVNEAIMLPAATTQLANRTITNPEGEQIQLAPAATTFDAADHPGIYHLRADGQDIPLAVNLSPDEGRTAPIATEELEQYGAKLGSKPLSDDVVARQRQLQVSELESRQKFWQWLLLGVLGLLIAETALAGRL